jgi:hypothetical protein
LLFIDTAAIRRFLHAHGPQLIQHAIRVRSITSEHAEKTLAKFLDVAGLFDTVFAAARLGGRLSPRGDRRDCKWARDF